MSRLCVKQLLSCGVFLGISACCLFGCSQKQTERQFHFRTAIGDTFDHLQANTNYPLTNPFLEKKESTSRLARDRFFATLNIPGLDDHLAVTIETQGGEIRFPDARLLYISMDPAQIVTSIELNPHLSPLTSQELVSLLRALYKQIQSLGGAIACDGEPRFLAFLESVEKETYRKRGKIGFYGYLGSAKFLLVSWNHSEEGATPSFSFAFTLIDEETRSRCDA